MAIAGEVGINLQGIKKRLVVHYSIVILLTVVILEGVFICAVRHYYFGSVEQSLVNEASVAAALNNKYLGDWYYSLKDKAKYIMDNIDENERVYVQVVDRVGNIVLDSNGFVPQQKIITPEIKDALAGKTGVWKGKNHTGERILSVANPIKFGDRIAGVLRYVVSLENIYQVVNKIIAITIFIGLVVILLLLVLSQLMAKSIITPLKSATITAGQMAAGDFSVKATKYRDDEVGKLVDTLNYMSEEIVKSEKIKNDFISSISHELRTPLTSIKGWAETLLTGEMEDKEETREGLKIISKETDRLVGLVEELLDFSRLYTKKLTINIQKVKINNILEEVKRQYEITAEDKDVQLQLTVDEEIAEIKGDFNRLKQVFINLIDNALKFTPNQGTVQISTNKLENNIVIKITDNGVGIAADDLPRVTEKFFKGSSKRSGSGLGLSISKEIIELHGGHMEVTSTAGKGTTVIIYLPAD